MIKQEAMGVRDVAADYAARAGARAMPEGYKLTEVGVIPEDWDSEKLGALCSSVLDCHHSTPKWTNSGAVVIRNQNIREGKLDLSDPSFTDKQTFTERTRRAVPTFGDLVITREAPMGSVCLIPKGLRCCLGQRMVLLRPNSNLIEPRYLLYALLSEDVQNSIAVAGGTGSTVSNLRIPFLKDIEINTPGLLEQSAIATALSDVDALLEALDRLSAKKRDLKQAAMQQLLTSQTRLPGFEGEWEVRELQEIATFHDNLRVPVTESKREVGLTPYYGANGIQGHIKGHTHDGEFVLFAEDGANDLNDYPVLYVNGKVWVNNHAHVIQGVANKAKTKYLSYALKAIDFVQALVGGTRAKLNASAAKALEITIPADIAEQDAILTVLSDMDAELEALQQRRTKTAALKQAMMQELLTGRTRLVGPMPKEYANG